MFLLIATNDVADNKCYACGDVSVIVKTRDHRLNCKLSIPEFVLAFSLFRDIVCSVSPHRREELDHYLFAVVELGQKFGGFTIIIVRFPPKPLKCFLNIRWSQSGVVLILSCFAGILPG